MYRSPSVIEDRKIRFALLGCGRISPNHIEAIRANSERAELVAVCDTNPTALENAVKSTGTPGFSSLAAMLQNTEADVISLCTPSGLHPTQAIQVARAGRHTISEKPMACRLEEAREMLRVHDEEGTRLFVVKQNRLNETLQMLKSAVDQGRFGRIHMVSINVFWSRPQSYYDQAPWHGTWELDGGAFMNQASHYVDLLNWLIGPVESIFSFTATRERKIEAEDTGVMALRWRSGTLGTMNVTMLTYPKNLEGSITILGENGTVRIGGVAVNEILHWEFKDKRPEDANIREASYQTTSVYGHGHPRYYAGVIKALQGGPCTVSDGREGLRSLELLVGAYQSARQGQPSHLPLAWGSRMGN